MAEYKIVIEKDYLVFACGHFITYSETCEHLHGHNYRARVELEGALDDNWEVWDFVSLKRLMRRLVDEMDHRMLLPLHNPAIKLSEEAGHVHVAASLFHDIAPASELGLRSVWINRLGETPGPEPTRELPDLARLPDTLDELVPA